MSSFLGAKRTLGSRRGNPGYCTGSPLESGTRNYGLGREHWEHGGSSRAICPGHQLVCWLESLSLSLLCLRVGLCNCVTSRQHVDILRRKTLLKKTKKTDPPKWYLFSVHLFSFLPHFFRFWIFFFGWVADHIACFLLHFLKGCCCLDTGGTRSSAQHRCPGRSAAQVRRGLRRERDCQRGRPQEHAGQSRAYYMPSPSPNRANQRYLGVFPHFPLFIFALRHGRLIKHHKILQNL